MSHITLKKCVPSAVVAVLLMAGTLLSAPALAQERPALTGRDGTICTEHVGFATKKQFETEIKALLFELATIEPLLMG